MTTKFRLDFMEALKGKNSSRDLMMEMIIWHIYLNGSVPRHIKYQMITFIENQPLIADISVAKKMTDI